MRKDKCNHGLLLSVSCLGDFSGANLSMGVSYFVCQLHNLIPVESITLLYGLNCLNIQPNSFSRRIHHFGFHKLRG